MSFSAILYLPLNAIPSPRIAPHSQQSPHIEWADFRNALYKSWQYGFSDGLTLNQLLPNTPGAQHVFAKLLRSSNNNLTEFWGELYAAQDNGTLNYSSEKIAVSYAFFVCGTFLGELPFCPRPCNKTPSLCQRDACLQTESGLYRSNYKCVCGANYVWADNLHRCILCGVAATWSSTLNRCVTSDVTSNVTGGVLTPAKPHPLSQTQLRRAHVRGPDVLMTEKVDKSWLNWESWGECSASCGLGTRMRIRYCVNVDHPELCTSAHADQEVIKNVNRVSSRPVRNVPTTRHRFYDLHSTPRPTNRYLKNIVLVIDKYCFVDPRCLSCFNCFVDTFD